MALEINEKCICCRMCEAVCPTKAIYYKGKTFAINPDKCVMCGTCLDYCNRNAITNPGQMAPAKSASTPRCQNCDLVVVGGGGAGLVTAVRFAEQTEKQVILLEKAENLGGSAWYAAGMMIPASELGISMGVPDTREEMKARVRRESAPYGGIDDKLIDVTVDAQKDVFDWFCQLPGFGDQFDVRMTPHHVMGLDYAHCISGGRGGLGRYVVIRMKQRLRELGVEVYTSCEATGLITDSAGTISGVRAKDQDGELEIQCRAVMLASGSFICNQEMMERVCPAFAGARKKIQGHLYPPLTGDGIRMGEEIGAKVLWENMNVCLKGPSPMPLTHILQATGEWPENIFVNLDGKRWMNEGAVARLSHTMGQDVLDMTDLFLHQPQAHSLSIFDSSILEHSISYYLDPDHGNDFNKLTQEDVDGIHFFLESDDHTMAKADTIRELAQIMELDPDILQRTIDRYNELCRNGCDTDFGKPTEYLKPIENGPFYAIRCYPFCDGAFGGFPITTKMEVQKQDGGVLPGLYAGGDITDSRFIPFTHGWDKKTQIMTDLPWAYVSGFLAADSIAAYLEQ